MAKQSYGFRSLRFKLALTSTLVEVVMLAILIGNSAAIATQALEDQTRYRVREIVPLLNASLAAPLAERDYATLDEILSQIVRKDGIEYLSVTNEDQHVVSEVGVKPQAYKESSPTNNLDAIDSYQHIDIPINLANSSVGELHMSIDISFLQATIGKLRREGIMIAGGEVVLTFVLLVLVGVLLTRNLATLANAARSMTAGDLTVRVTTTSRDEIGATARAFNAMAARLDASYNSLKQSEQRYQLLTEVSPVGVFNTNAEGQCIYVNERYSEISGLPQERFFGTGWMDTLHPDDRDFVVREWTNCAAVGMPYVGEHRIINAQGKVVWVYVQAVKTAFADSGYGGGYVGTVTDITRLKTVEQELAQHRDSLEQLVNARTAELEAAQERLLRQERLATLGQLTATVSHELRNPLGVISNAAYYLKRKLTGMGGQADKKIIQYLEMIEREVVASDRIISDLLATSRIKDPAVQWLSLDELVDAIISSTTIPEGIQWQYDREPKPFMLRADPAQLTQVLRNLINNAIQAILATAKHQGLIRLEARNMAGQYRLKISDTGPGVATEARSKIFEPLFTTKVKGNGLGLWISREIIRGHGGSLTYVGADGAIVDTAEKCAEVGAVFLITLPTGGLKKNSLSLDGEAG